MSTATRKRIPDYLTIQAVVTAALKVARADPDESPTQRQLAAEAKVSPSTVNMILKIMDDAGLITRTKTGGRIKRLNFKTVTEGVSVVQREAVREAQA